MLMSITILLSTRLCDLYFFTAYTACLTFSPILPDYQLELVVVKHFFWLLTCRHPCSDSNGGNIDEC